MNKRDRREALKLKWIVFSKFLGRFLDNREVNMPKSTVLIY
jgi:hypothetical protein